MEREVVFTYKKKKCKFLTPIRVKIWKKLKSEKPQELITSVHLDKIISENRNGKYIKCIMVTTADNKNHYVSMDSLNKVKLKPRLLTMIR